MNSLYQPKFELIRVPFGDNPIYDVQLIYLHKWNHLKRADAPMEYLLQRANLNKFAKHALRELQTIYLFQRPLFVRHIAGAIPDGIDAIVMVPSCSDELMVYRDEIINQHTDMRDLSPRVKRLNEDISSTSGNTNQERLDNISYTPLPCGRPSRKILILDDVLHTGLSIAGVAKALSAHLRPAVEFVAACLLWVPISRKQ